MESRFVGRIHRGRSEGGIGSEGKMKVGRSDQSLLIPKGRGRMGFLSALWRRLSYGRSRVIGSSSSSSSRCIRRRRRRMGIERGRRRPSGSSGGVCRRRWELWLRAREVQPCSGTQLRRHYSRWKGNGNGKRGIGEGRKGEGGKKYRVQALNGRSTLIRRLGT